MNECEELRPTMETFERNHEGQETSDLDAAAKETPVKMTVSSSGENVESYLPDWVEADGDEEQEETSRTSSSARLSFDRSLSSKKEGNLLEDDFSEEIWALILSHLTLSEIASASQVSTVFYEACRSNSLWKRLVDYRWNVPTSCNIDQDYFRSYQQAYAHPHDLWITHWNCVFPNDGLAPGRCCIRPSSNDSRSSTLKRKGQRKDPEQECPTCRDWKSWDSSNNDSSSRPRSRAQAMAQATRRTRQKFGDFADLDAPLSPRKAFRIAATFHRKLQTRQYETTSSTNFLTDLIFFNLTSPEHSDGQWELQQLLCEAQSNQNDDDDDDGRNPLYETAHHSWHMIQLTNSDFVRPIIFQIGIQRPECFTAHPSEGFIPPGSTVNVTLGVRPLGSALAYAFEGLNVQRDGLDAKWADLYTEEAHLPLAPFLIRYRFAATQPIQVDGARYDPREPPSYLNSSRSKKSSKHVLVDYHWKQQVPAHQMRTIHLSAHVHAHYSFWQFVYNTCSPFNNTQDVGPIFSAPELQEMYPGVYERLENVERQELPKIVRSHTETCSVCGQTWGFREEEMAQAFMVMRGECCWQQERRRILLRNVVKCVGLLERGIMGDAATLSALFYQATCLLQSLKAAPWTSLHQKRFLIQLEAILDRVYEQIPVGGEDWVPWRLEGVYRYAVCTDSVFGGLVAFQGNEIEAVWKDEPDFLDAFRHLAHSPGRFCLGPQEDPNHLGETIVPSSKRYFRKQKGLTTDIFMDDPISALQAGICMMQDPRSLLVHGLYDRIPYPGSVVRRPRTLQPLLFPSPERGTENKTLWLLFSEEQCPCLIGSSERLAYLQLQNGLDLDSVAEIDALCSGNTAVRSHANASMYESMNIYLNSIPPPGVGRFALSQAVVVDSGERRGKVAVVALEFEGEPEEVNPRNVASDSQQQGDFENEPRLPQVARPRNIRGPRILHLLWVLGAQLGLAVIDNPDSHSVFVDRKILIASQWVCISLMAGPLFWTLCARYYQWIPARPMDYDLRDLPFEVRNEMRFLTEQECGLVALLLLLVWLALGRWTERHTSRDFFRVMLDHVSPAERPEGKMRFFSQLRSSMVLWSQRQWDSFCPLFLQRRVFTPQWNRRTRGGLLQHIAFWRGRNLSEQRSAAPASAGQGNSIFGDSRDEGICVGRQSRARNIFVGALVALGSFCSASPLFWLNVLTVFSCSISLGMSVSLHSMEKGASGVDASNTGSIAMLTTFSLGTVVILSFLIGQLVGSSGGTMFLAEFTVTSISLIFGGAGAMSASGMESWVCFFCLSTTAFWGYLFGRVALINGIREKRGGYATVLLSKSVAFLFCFWILVFLVTSFDAPVDLVIARPTLQSSSRHWSRKDAAIKRLQ